jgi:hypothetical protein
MIPVEVGIDDVANAQAAAGVACESTTSTSSSLTMIEALQPTAIAPVPTAW